MTWGDTMDWGRPSEGNSKAKTAYGRRAEGEAVKSLLNLSNTCRAAGLAAQRRVYPQAAKLSDLACLPAIYQYGRLWRPGAARLRPHGPAPSFPRVTAPGPHGLRAPAER